MTLKSKPFNNSKRMEKMQSDLSNHKTTKLLNCLIPIEIFEEFKILAVRNKTTMTDLIIELMLHRIERDKSPT